MNIQIIILSFLCGSLRATMDNERMLVLRNKTKNTLKDIRLVPTNREERETQDWNDQIQEEQVTTNLERKKINTRALQAKSGKENNLHSDSNEGSNNKEYIQKMANQLFLAQKQVSILSDYQKSILSQDPLVKRFVFGPSEEARVPKPFSQFGRRSTLTDKRRSHKITTTTPKETLTKKFDPKPKLPRKSSNIITRTNNDNSAQAADINYVTIAPITSTGYIHVKVLPEKEDLVQTPKPYLFYDVTVSPKPEIDGPEPITRVPHLSSRVIPRVTQRETQAVTPEVTQRETQRVTPKASSRASRYIQENIKNFDHNDEHYGNAKYEFKYNVKDHEKNSHFGHLEARSDETTYGYYFVHLPDGRLETVKYWADKTGYHAKVDYQGEAKHPPAAEYKHKQLYL